MKNSSKDSKDIMNCETSGANGGSGGGVISKKAKKVTYEKKLEEVMKELQSKTGGGTNAKGVKKKLKPEQEVLLLEQKCVLLLKLRRHKEVVDDGYSIIGRMGPNVTVYKCILIALVRLGKGEDEFMELLESWKKATPKCPQMLEARRKFDGYLAALRSGMKNSDIFSGIEDALTFNADSILNKQLAEATTSEEKKWRFRAPPPRHTTFSLCPRLSPANSCIYGDECLFAHSVDELKEWKMRVEFDKKNNNFSEDALTEENRVTKKRLVAPPIYRTLSIPPLCINYLLDLGKKIKEAVDIKEVLVDEIAGVKLKIDTPLHFRKRADGINRIQCTWSFMVGSKTPMGTVSILHDANRECFNISTGLYFNKKKESIGLIELHPNNKVQTRLQVLNTFIQPSLFLSFNSGWPEVCYYKVDVTFESRDPFPEPGLYRQSIVFDFKKDPKVVKHISVEVLPKVQPIGNHLTEANNASNKLAWCVATPPPPADASSEIFSGSRPVQRIPNVYNGFNVEKEEQRPIEFSSNIGDFPSLTQLVNNQGEDLVTKTTGSIKGMDLVDSETGKVVRLKGVALTPSEENELMGESNLFLENVPLTKENYRTWMRDFLDVELISRQKVVNRFKKTMNVRLTQHCIGNPDYMYRFSFIGDLYGHIELMSDMACDLKLERLIGHSCNAVIISAYSDPSSPFTLRKLSRRYLCRIVSKSKSAICIAVGGKAKDELQLLYDSIEKLQVQFVLDAAYVDRIQFTLEALSSYQLELLFPDFENSKLPFLKVMDSIGLLNEEELLLNNRQMSVYNLVLGRKVLIDGDVFTPPILVTGGVSTGKSYLLANCMKGILRSQRGIQPNRILVCTLSDLAADTYITDFLHEWLINDELSVQKSKPLRVYDKNRFVDSVSGAVKHYCLFDDDGTSFRYPTRDEVLSHRIIFSTFSTCSELIKLGLEDDTFSHVVIDEATSCLEAECVMPIILSGRNSKIVLAGDVMQSPTNIFSLFKGVPPISLLERLRNAYPFRHPFVVNLVENYVNHEVIAKFISHEFYHDQLRGVSIQPPHPKYYPLTFHHIPTSREMLPDNGGGSYNLEEIRYVADFAEELIQSWPETWGAPDRNSVIILTPYTNHINCLRLQLQIKGLQNVNVELASNVLGRKYRVVIISTVRTYKQNLTTLEANTTDGGFFYDRRLLIAAISAAKSLVVAFGDAHSLWSHGTCKDIWRQFLTECQLHQSLKDVRAPKTEDSRHTSSTQSAQEKMSALNLNSPQPLLVDNSLLPLTTSFGTTRPSSFIQPPSLAVSEVTLTPRSYTEVNETMASHLPSAVGAISKTSASVDKVDSSWNISSGLKEAPKTDLFSAFSTTAEPLYSSKSSNTFSTEVEGESKTQGNPQALHYPEASSNLSLSDAIASFTGVSPGKSATMESQSICPQNEQFLSNSQVKSLHASSYRPLQAFESPLELTLPAKDLKSLNISSATKENVKPDDILNTIQNQSMDPMPLPVPTIPSHVLFDQRRFIDNRPKFYESSHSQYELGNMYNNSPQKVSPPLMRSPPGFTPIASSVNTQYGNFHPIDDKVTFPDSPSRNVMSNGGTTLKYYKKNTYELPPRLLKNMQLSGYKSPMKKKQSKPQPAEMNFFEELGLDSQTTVPQEASRSISSASSDHSFLDFDEANSLAEEECPNTVSNDEWTEVKSTRKGKRNNLKKLKGKGKRLPSLDGDLTSADLRSSEICVDDKVELINQMGFTKSQAIKALQACDKDLQRAVDWLISKPTSNKSNI